MRWYVFFGLLLFSSCAEGLLQQVVEGPEGIKITIDYSTESLQLGDSLNATISMKYPKGYKPAIDDLARNLTRTFGPMTSPFRLVSSQNNSIDEQTLKAEFVLSPQRVGKFPLSFLQVLFVPNDPKKNSPISVVTDIVTIDVAPPSEKIHVPVETLMAPLFPIGLPYTLLGIDTRAFMDSPEDVITTNKSLIESKSFPWLLFISFIILTAVFWLIKYTAAHPAPVQEKEADVEGSRQQALKELNQILAEEEQLPDEVRSIDTTLRDYLQNAYRIRAPSQTTQELLHDIIQTHKFDDDTVSHISQLFLRLDAAKYSPVKIPSEKAHKLATVATQIITKIKK